jgi:hypothetical protein
MKHCGPLDVPRRITHSSNQIDIPMLITTLPKMLARSTALVIASWTSIALADSLLLNGDFSGGNTGFSSQHSYSETSITSEGLYTIGSDPMLFHPLAYGHFGDHTTGNGLMFMVNASLTPNLYVWQETVSVDSNASYLFTGFATLWGGWTPSYFSLSINGQTLKTVSLDSHAQWSSFSSSWDSGLSNQATIQIFATPPNVSDPSIYEDIALDDLSFAQVVPEPTQLELVAVGMICLVLSFAYRRKRRLTRAVLPIV